MKKRQFISAGMAAAMIMALTACGGSKPAETTAAETTAAQTTAAETTAVQTTAAQTTAEAQNAGETAAEKEEKTNAAEAAELPFAELNIAVVKQMDHIALDEIAKSITDELDVIAEQNGIQIHYEVYSGQGDQSTLKQICDQAVADQVDAIIPVATLASQVAAVCAEESKTPVIFASVSDPEAAALTGIDYVTGTSDALNTEFIMDMMLAQNPEIDKVGFLYSLSEVNSARPIADAKKYLDAKGIEYVEQTANTNDEVVAAAASLAADGVDAVFTPTDNVIMAAELAIYESFIDAKIPHYTGADEFVIQGAFATCGVNYPGLGTQTADLAFEALRDGMDSKESFYLVDGGIITVNTETAEAIGADYKMFADMGDLVEVQTSETR